MAKKTNEPTRIHVPAPKPRRTAAPKERTIPDPKREAERRRCREPIKPEEIDN